MKPLTNSQALFFGTLTVGGLDIVDALVFFGLRGVPPIRIFQSIASGLLGKSAYAGGLPTAFLGGLLHFFIAFGVVAVFLLASRRFPQLARHPLLLGPVYGLLVFAVMYLVVLPLSAAGGRLPSGTSLINALAIHMLGVGLPSALFASWLEGPSRGLVPGPPESQTG
ncbi:MAG: hypothetical protein KDD11_20405 [Acidobacteria bacterium]|nr:hypothetical protein [Acidobacteriota bacterium]